MIRLIVILLLLVVAAAASLAGVLFSFNHFDEIERAFDGRCTPVTGIPGPEDIALTPDRDRAFISSLDRRASDARGAIHAFDVTDFLADGAWRDMTDGAPEIFQPLGLSYWEGEGAKRLFVVNAAANSVELYDVGPGGALAHLETFTDPLITSPNNVAGVGPRSFYVTNDVKDGRGALLGDLYFLLRAGRGQVIFVEDARRRIVADGLQFANGVALSPDGSSVYVAEMTGDMIRVFDRNSENGALSHRASIATPAAPDNLTVDPEGVIWAAGSPKPLSLALHGGDEQNLAPSSVMRVSPEGVVDVVYRDTGAELSAATVAARTRAGLMIGALYENKFLICELPADAK